MSEAVQVAFITSGFALVGTLAALILPKLRKQGRDVRAVMHQVQNSHGTNLRDDIDKVLHGLEKVHETLMVHADVLTNLRTDITWERRERMDLARRVEGREPLA